MRGSVLIIQINLILLLSVLVQAEPPVQQWVARYNGPTDSQDVANAMTIDSSGNVYVTGYTDYNYPATRGDYATIKYDPNGNELWTARYSYPANKRDWPFAMAVDKSGNVFVTGYSEDINTQADYATVKYDPNGNELWVARYNGPGNNWDWAHALTVDDSGNVYVTGESLTSIEERYAFTTIKYDPNGNKLWVARYDGPGHWKDRAYAIAIDNSGNIYVTGDSGNTYGDFVNNIDFDYVTIKYDNDGNQLWVARYNGPPGDSKDAARAIAVDNSGNVYVTGESIGSGTQLDYATVKYDPNGNQLWVARYDGPKSWDDLACALVVDGSGNVYVTGECDANTPSFKTGDYATVKYDPNGNELWAVQYDGPIGWGDHAYAIALDKLGNVYVTGASYKDGAYYDYTTIKYDPNGNQLWLINYNGPANGEDRANALAVDDLGNVYLTGYSTGSGTSYDYGTIKYTQHDWCLEPIAGDLNNDCKVDFEDFAVITSNWLDCNFALQEDCW